MESENTSQVNPPFPETLAKYKEIISTLPQDHGWKTFEPLCQYQDFWYMAHTIEGVMFAQEHFKPHPNSILLCSAMKTGTTWLKALAFAIATRSKYGNSTNPLLTKVPHDCIPFLEIDFLENPNSMNVMHDQLDIPIWSTHVPYHSLPKSVLNSGCKIVYICRNPKDVFVSMWHFMKKVTKKMAEEVNFVPLEEAFELFCKGISLYAPYWDHVLGFWKASLELPDTVLFLKYEEMMTDPMLYTKKLAEFLGYPFSEEEEKGGEIQRIVDLCSFENLSNLEVNKTGTHRPENPSNVDNNVYFRKGKVGDWKNHLTPEMGEKLDAICEEKLSGFGLKLCY